MSDAMTNREIEDVLTSIRRLVAQEGAPRGDTGRLVLTEAQRITAPPLVLTLGAKADDLDGDEPTSEHDLPAPDFGKLEATIAELEAAVSATGGSWESDSVDENPKASNVTELYGRLSFVHRADEVARADEPVPAVGSLAAAPAEPAEPLAEPATETETEADPVATEALSVQPDLSDREEAGLEEGILDEDALRAMIAQIVREELHGQLGERITAQVRKLVRAEIAKALDERSFL
ncbi:hypothetical protein [Pararhodobacter zhoushanensis]|uniref:DUF2497 domain-containing protein n=1 Tax=Pararhodobacter zhoushanensis TaxID=2479545 RepID=A0ABT3H0S2_9RHOB|nr:hypothetical protein [Pararhodobacter zhoushanensis]MCW1933425.1 hypothetical protein [Pararhodobacter zhoushanensis]